MTFANGDIFEGTFDNGIPINGEYKYSNDNIYNGQVNDQYEPNVEGKMTFANGDTFEGTFKDGIPNVKGKMTFANGDIFEGTFDNGIPINGEYKYSNDNIYIGKVNKDYKPDGEGKMKSKNKIIFNGRWNEGNKIQNSILQIKIKQKPKK